MSGNSTSSVLFARQPLATLGRVSVIALCGSAALCGILAFSIGLPDGLNLFIITAVLLICAGLVATGVCWTPLLGTLVSGITVVAMMVATSYPIYHLTHPQADFFSFVLDVLIIVFLVATFCATLSATIQNYRSRERNTPRWLSSFLAGLGGLVVGVLVIAAIAQPTAATSTTNTQATSKGGTPTVHMGPGSFLQPSITISKGAKLLLVDDGAFPHFLANGSWENGTPKPAREPDAPVLNNVQVNGKSIEIGPFNMAGTYHIYCTIHRGMNLTIIVQ